jgi:hypothetical protein
MVVLIDALGNLARFVLGALMDIHSAWSVIVAVIARGILSARCLL